MYKRQGEGSAAANIDGQWYGSLEEVDAASGYWVQSNLDAEFVSVCGDPSDDVVYTLHDANNLISYAYPGSQDIGDALPDDTEDAVYAIVGEGVASINLGSMWAGSLEAFEGGNGYWLVATSDFEFSFNGTEEGLSRQASQPELRAVPELYRYAQSTAQSFYFVANATIGGESLESDDMHAIKKTIDVDIHNLDGITNMTSLVTVGTKDIHSILE